MQRTVLAFFLTCTCFVSVLGAADLTLDQVEPNDGTNEAWVTSSAMPVFRGTGPAGASIVVSAFRLLPPTPRLEQQRLVRVDPVGVWQTDMQLNNGDFQIQVTTDPTPTPLPIDGVRARQITVAARRQTEIGSILPDGGVPNDFITGPGIITIVGRGEPGASVEVSLSSVASPTPVVIGVSTITANGTWSATTPTALVADQYLITALVTVGSWSSPASRTLSVTDTAATLTFTGLQVDSGTSSDDGITTTLPTQAMFTVTQGSIVSLTIPELDAVSEAGLPSYYYDLVDGGDPTRPQINLLVVNDHGLSTFTYRAIATAPNGSTAEASRTVQLDRAPVPLAILALGSNDGTDPNDSVVATGTPVISGHTEPGALVSIYILRASQGPMAGGFPGQPSGSPIVWLPTTQVEVAADGSWTFSVPDNLPAGNLAYDLILSATRPLSGRTSSIQRSFTVEASAALSWDAPPAITYGTGLGAQQLDAVNSVPGLVTYDPPEGSILGAGVHQLTALLTPTDTALPAVTAHVELTVLAAPLQITADNATRIVGTNNPAFTVTYAGFVAGENATVLSSFPQVTTVADATSPVGSYPLLIDGATAANYLITQVPGVLSVSAIPNDLLSGAEVLVDAWSGSLTADNTFATREATEPLHAGIAGGRSLWYRWTAPANGLLEVHTLGSSFDTLLALYTKSTSGALRSAGANDNRSTTIVQSLRTRTVLAGQVYYIAVDGKADAHGPLVLTWVLRSGNDRFVEPQNLASAIVGTVSVDNTHATSETSEPDHVGAAGGRSVWFLWTAPHDGTLVLETTGSQNTAGGELDTVLALYTGDAINRLKSLGGEDDDRDSVTSAIGAKVNAGTVYRIVVDVSRTAPMKNGTVVLSWLLRAPIAD